MTTKEIKEAEEAMKRNKVEELFMTSDGKFFLTKNTANNHSLRDGGKKREKALKVTTVNSEMLSVETKKSEKTDTTKKEKK